MTDAAAPAADLTAQLARLERRLERERAARLEAEAIAEAETRALYEHVRRLRLLETVARDCNQEESLRGVIARTLQRICEFAGWTLGHAYFVETTAEGSRLCSAHLWHPQSEAAFADFRAVSEARAFAPGQGLPGRVYDTAASVWVSDVTRDPNFPRAPMARACGLRAAFAFPVLVGSEVAAVLEFFLDRELAPDTELLHTLNQIGAVLGRAIERDRAERLSRDTQAELERMVAEAQAASAAKTTFLAVTSHEVRTPLNAVLGLAEALARGPLGERQRELVDGIRDSGGILLRLVNAVLDVAKIETGRISIVAAPFDLAQIAATVARLWRLKAEEGGVDLRLDLSGLAQPCRLISDGGKIEQALVNLVSNALKFTPPGGTVTLRLSGADAGARRRILAEVLDDGAGVPDEDRARIFEAYEQTAAGRDAGGAGLGLAICAGNVQALGGRIGVAPRPDGGSRFWFEFEAAAAAADPAPAIEPEPAEFDARLLRVLAAEDNAANRMVLRLLLEPAGVVPVFAEDGAQALAAARAQPFDLILMDANMPVMDGAEATRRIRALPGPAGRIPIHMLTANVFDEDRRRYLDAGVDSVIAKPIVVEDLYAVLATAAEAVAQAGQLSQAS